MHPIIGISSAVWLAGTVLNLGIRLDWPRKDDTHTAVGKSILWPLFVLRFAGLSLYHGAVALFTLQ